MRPFYESQFHFQEGWSSLQTRSCSLSNTHRGLTLQTGTLANLRARTTLKMCSKNLQVAPNCGSWVNNPFRLGAAKYAEFGEHTARGQLCSAEIARASVAGTPDR